MSEKAINAADWPANNVSMRRVSELIPYARNSRTHSKGQIKQIAASIREWGWTSPILVDEHGTILAGHGRVMAAELLKTEQVPVMTAKGWSDTQKRAYVIADNKLALNAGWDDEILTAEFLTLKEEDFDVTLTGFDEDEFIMPDFQPGGMDEQGALDTLEPKMITCPHCSEQFDTREHE